MTTLVLVFEHVTQQFLHGSVPDGPVEEQQLYLLRIHKTQRGKKKKQLSKPKYKKYEKKKKKINLYMYRNITSCTNLKYVIIT